MKNSYQLKIIVGLLLLITVGFISGNQRFYIVKTGSMEPVIPIYSIAIVKPRNAYKESDIITYELRNSSIIATHRITNVRNINGQYYYEVRGDNNERSDPYLITDQEIIGSVERVITLTSKILKFVLNTDILWITFYAPCGVFLGRLFKRLQIHS